MDYVGSVIAIAHSDFTMKESEFFIDFIALSISYKEILYDNGLLL